MTRAERQDNWYWGAFAIGGVLGYTSRGFLANMFGLYGLHHPIIGVGFGLLVGWLLADYVSKQYEGLCPHCGEKVLGSKPGFDCRACSQRIIVRESRFLTREEAQPGRTPDSWGGPDRYV